MLLRIIYDHTASSFEVQQRGVKGAVAILQQCLQGVQVPDGCHIHVFDVTPNRFAEWSRAVWDRQLHNLKNPDSPVEKFTYTGYFVDVDEMKSQQKEMLGRAMEDNVALQHVVVIDSTMVLVL